MSGTATARKIQKSVANRMVFLFVWKTTKFVPKKVYRVLFMVSRLAWSGTVSELGKKEPKMGKEGKGFAYGNELRGQVY